MTHTLPLVLIVFVLLMAGCSFFGSDKGEDRSELKVDHSCVVDISQQAKVFNADVGEVIESVSVKPDCTTEIKFRQAVGDHYIEETQAESQVAPEASKEAPTIIEGEGK
jgi:hypothetical protein